MMLTEYAATESLRQESRAMYQTTEQKWPAALAAPVDPADTLLCMRAQSALSGPELGVVHDLTVEQARCVMDWYSPKH